MRPYSSYQLESLAYALLFNEKTQAVEVAAESAMAKGSTTSLVTGMLGYIHLVHGNIEAAEPWLVHSLGKNPSLYPAHYSLSEMYFALNRCEESEPQMNWLRDYFENEARKVSLENALEEGYENRL